MISVRNAKLYSVKNLASISEVKKLIRSQQIFLVRRSENGRRAKQNGRVV